MTSNGNLQGAEDGRPLNILIIGGGIGGLSAATFLRHAGHIVEVAPIAPMRGPIN